MMFVKIELLIYLYHFNITIKYSLTTEVQRNGQLPLPLHTTRRTGVVSGKSSAVLKDVKFPKIT